MVFVPNQYVLGWGHQLLQSILTRITRVTHVTPMIFSFFRHGCVANCRFSVHVPRVRVHSRAVCT